MFDIDGVVEEKPKKVKKKNNKPDNQKRNNNINLDSNTIKVIAISLGTFIFVLIVSLLVFRGGKDYSIVKEDPNKDIVYTKYDSSNGNYYIYVPYLNIKSDTGANINNEIDEFVNPLISTEKSIVSYDYNISGNILSLIINTIQYDSLFAPQVYFKSYNINLKDLTLIDYDTLLSKYNVSTSDVSEIIQNNMKKYYKEVLDKEYFYEDECDYDCFLHNRDIENYLDNVAYYVEDSKLYVYKPFVTYSIFGEEDYFKDEHFKMLVK